MGEIKDLTGRKFNRWSVIGLHQEKDRNGQQLWFCVCDCGTEKYILGGNLKRGLTKSCGCFKKEVDIARGITKKRDLTNLKFGRITALEETKKRQNRRIIWRCICDCGNEKEILSGELLSGNVRSCGCLQKDSTKERLQLLNKDPIFRSKLEAASRMAVGDPDYKYKRRMIMQQYYLNRKSNLQCIKVEK